MKFRVLWRSKNRDMNPNVKETGFNQSDWRFRRRRLWVMRPRTLELLATPIIILSLILFVLSALASMLRAANQYALARKIEGLIGSELLLMLASSLFAFAVICMVVAIAGRLTVEIDGVKGRHCKIRYVWHDPETMSVHLDGDFKYLQNKVRERLAKDTIFLLEKGVHRIELLSPVLVGKEARINELERYFHLVLQKSQSNATVFICNKIYGRMMGALLKLGWKVNLKCAKNSKAMPWRSILSTRPYAEAGVVIEADI